MAGEPGYAGQIRIEKIASRLPVRRGIRNRIDRQPLTLPIPRGLNWPRRLLLGLMS